MQLLLAEHTMFIPIWFRRDCPTLLFHQGTSNVTLAQPKVEAIT